MIRKIFPFSFEGQVKFSVSMQNAGFSLFLSPWSCQLDSEVDKVVLSTCSQTHYRLTEMPRAPFANGTYLELAQLPPNFPYLLETLRRYLIDRRVYILWDRDARTLYILSWRYSETPLKLLNYTLRSWKLLECKQNETEKSVCNFLWNCAEIKSSLIFKKRGRNYKFESELISVIFYIKSDSSTELLKNFWEIFIIFIRFV